MIFWGVLLPRTLLISAFTGVLILPAAAQSSSLLDVLSDELKRNFTVLQQKGDPPAYFLAYAVTEEEAESMSASFGALHGANRNNSRSLDVTLRLGTAKLDNYHRMRGEGANFTGGVAIPLEDSPNSVRRKAWSETDRIYRLATQRLIRLKTNTQVKAAEEDSSDDFSVEEPSEHIEAITRLKPASPEWAQKIRKWSEEFGRHRGILSSNVILMVSRQSKYLVNSEGTRIQHSRGFARIMITAQGKASDGMDLSAYESFEGETLDRLPKDEVIQAAVARVAQRVTDLLRAPLVDPFVGPAILSGGAAGVFFHEIFGHRVEGHRQKDESEGQTFTKSVGKPVLPEFLSVTFDPTRKSVGKLDLNGSYLYDDEGVKGRPVKVVEKGILSTFLMSRSPIRNFSKSNGHGRRQAGYEVVSRQSNLLVESAKAVSRQKLRELLIEEVKKQNKPYGLLFDQVTGGYTTTGRQGLQAFTVMPLVVFRVYADGRPDELVRGVNIVGTPLSSFANIAATSDELEVFNGICGAESGGVPVSAVSPALLVTGIEIQRKAAGVDSPPALARPVLPGGSY